MFPALSPLGSAVKPHAPPKLLILSLRQVTNLSVDRILLSSIGVLLRACRRLSYKLDSLCIVAHAPVARISDCVSNAQKMQQMPENTEKAEKPEKA